MDAAARQTAVRQTYWQLTLVLLTAHLAGWPAGLPLVVALNAVQAVHFLAWHRSVRSLEVQVRWLYLSLLAAGAVLPGGTALHAFMTAGLATRLSVEYCLAARLLLLMPWNRDAPFSAALLRATFLTPPAPGPVAPRVRSALASA